MPVITTRQSEVDLVTARLQTLVEYASRGGIKFGGDFEPGDDVDTLIEQLEVTAQVMLETFDAFNMTIEKLAVENVALKFVLDKVQDKYESLADVEYDEDLDHATIDTMEALIASGASETTANGELSFNAAVTITKEDFKPIVRQTLTSWLERKIK